MQRRVTVPDGKIGAVERPRLTALDGEGMSADEAAWAEVADAVGRALTFPGVSPQSMAELQSLQVSASLCARLPAFRSALGSP